MIKLPTSYPPAVRPRPRPKLPPLPYPHQQEHDYAAALIFAAKQLAGGIRAQLLSRLPRIVAATGGKRLPRTDARDEQLSAVMRELEAEYGITRKTARKWALRMLEGVSAFHARTFASAYGDAIAINPLAGRETWLAPAMNLAAEENAALITSIPTQLLGEVERMVSTAVVSGERVETLAASIMDRFNVTENRAALIAQDQVGKWLGSMNRLRQVDSGITHYEWSTSQDERVRPMHRALEGTRQSWSSPPVVDSKGRRAHPGHDFRCRCSGIPILPEYSELSEAAEE